jgi:hypothetical protein
MSAPGSIRDSRTSSLADLSLGPIHLTSLSESVAFVISARKASSEFYCESGVNTPGWTARHKKQERLKCFAW